MLGNAVENGGMHEATLVSTVYALAKTCQTSHGNDVVAKHKTIVKITVARVEVRSMYSNVLKWENF